MDDRLDELARRVRGVGRGTAATILARVVDVLTTYAFYAIIARSISVAAFGQLTVGFMILTTAASICRFGLDEALLTVRADGGVNRLAAEVIAAISIGVAIVVGAVLYVARIPLPPFAIWLVVALPVVALSQLIVGALRARGDLTWAAIAEGVVQPFAACALALGAKVWAPNAVGFSVALLLSFVVTLPFGLRLDWRGSRIARDSASELLRTGRSMLGVVIVRQASTSVDILLLGFLAGSVEVGRYAVAQKIALVFVLLQSAVIASVTPFMRSLADDRRLFEDYYHFVTRWMVSASLPLLVITIGAPTLILSLFGRQYETASSMPLLLLSFAGAVVLLTGPAGSVLLVSGESRELLRVSIAGAVALVVSVASLAHFGATATAAGVLVARLIGRGLMMISVRRVVSWSPFDIPLTAIIGGAVIGVLVTRFGAQLLGSIPAAAAGCAVALTIASIVLVRSGDLGIVVSEFRAPDATDGS